MDLTIPQILQAAAHELMRQYGRHQAPAIWQAIHTAQAVHDAHRTATGLGRLGTNVSADDF